MSIAKSNFIYILMMHDEKGRALVKIKNYLYAIGMCLLINSNVNMHNHSFISGAPQSIQPSSTTIQTLSQEEKQRIRPTAAAAATYRDNKFKQRSK